MSKVNFEPIAQAMELFDTDSMDIYRKTTIINPDGTTDETTFETPMYANISCHISFTSSDNPDADTADTKPIIMGLQVNCPLAVDIQNGDYIVARKLSSSGSTLETYSGVIGEPEVTQSRKSAKMQMRTDV